ncbi:hypothetical protein NliqN6_0596 [Naganishia liquefaciens]|uniref:Uncharacterized protein n=1 Tax=Naganishia liquefaciens TaxID=104408 RepID=A0A8H3TNN5_9TREE|nr:hypothetical protein NliqN6_0596 [Naganishia liquefaciens]
MSNQPLPPLPQSASAASLLQQLASPAPSFMDNTLPSYLVNEMIRTLRHSTRVRIKRRRKAQMEVRVQQGLGDVSSTLERMSLGDNVKGKQAEIPPLVTDTAKEAAEEDEDVRKGVQESLHNIGLQVGGNIVEHITVFRSPFSTHLETMKFICKEFFLFIYSKQIDNLRTNHRGVFVLQSNAFPPLIPISSTNGPQADVEAAKIYLVYPSALIQGALARLGINVTVSVESAGLPQCTFTIKMTRHQPTGTAYFPLNTVGGNQPVPPVPGPPALPAGGGTV